MTTLKDIKDNQQLKCKEGEFYCPVLLESFKEKSKLSKGKLFVDFIVDREYCESFGEGCKFIKKCEAYKIGYIKEDEE